MFNPSAQAVLCVASGGRSNEGFCPFAVKAFHHAFYNRWMESIVDLATIFVIFLPQKIGRQDIHARYLKSQADFRIELGRAFDLDDRVRYRFYDAGKIP